MKQIKFSEVKNGFLDSIQLFICSSSFEDRCLSVILNIDKMIIDHVAICHYEENYNKSIENKNRIVGVCDKADIQTTIISIYHDNPIKNCDAIVSAIKAMPVNSNILIDVSTFTRENILIIIKLSKSILSDYNINFCYTPSSHYSLGEGGDNLKCSLWLSRGVNDIRSVLGYSGEFSPLKKLLLIVLVGFEYERAQTLIDNYEPNRLIIGKANAEESISSELSAINDSHLELLKNMYPDAEPFEFSCKDINVTRNKIIELIAQYRAEYNIVISPMNNKISLIATSSVALDYPEIQICYATTNQYNVEGYSKSCDYFYYIDRSEI